MESGNFIEPAFVVKGESQVGYTNAGHVSRIMYADGKPSIGMPGQTCTCQPAETGIKIQQNVLTQKTIN